MQEADGYIGPKGIEIAFDLGDYELAKAICIRLSLNPSERLYDKRRLTKPTNAWSLFITQSQVADVLNLVNGYFVGPYKVEQIANQGWDKRLNQPLQQPLGNVLHNFWLAGFFDGNGCCYLSVIARNVKNKVRRDGTGLGITFYKQSTVHIKISQRQPELMFAVAAFFDFPKPKKQTRSEKTQDGKRRTVYAIASQSKIHVKQWLAYFNQYPLQSKKRAQLQLVEDGFKLIACKHHLTLEGQKTFLELQTLKQGLIIEHYENQIDQWIPEVDESGKKD